MNNNLKLIALDANNKHILENLAQGYEAEFSILTNKLPDLSGKFSLDVPLDFPYKAYIFYKDKIPIGFCVYNLEETPFDIAEFYVIPSMRGRKYGEYFAHKIFLTHKGRWQVKQISGAEYATKFWQKVIGRLTEYQEEILHDDYWGRVTKQIFIVVENV